MQKRKPQFIRTDSYYMAVAARGLEAVFNILLLSSNLPILLLFCSASPCAGLFSFVKMRKRVAVGWVGVI